ncbi:MAG: asparagine synthase (glutamine-hydrolyzing) [Thermoleophilia bacterium]
MCGITGFWDFRKITTKADLLKMTDTLAHRGPDDSGIFFDFKQGVGLGHRRLAIIDLSSQAKQPMGNDSGSIWVTFNGEIYNYRQIREELVCNGHQFRTNSDTEVILRAYEQWGIECISRFRGMFAFALWDIKHNKLFLVRDRLGVKPLYYYWDGHLLLFASELRALEVYREFKRDLDPQSLALYLRFGYVPSPRCIYANTHKVRPGCYLEVSSEGSLSEVCYWNLFKFSEAPIIERSESEIEQELVSILCEAFSYRLVSDVPVGIFLSGGIDSSLVAAILKCELGKSLQALTVGFDEAEKDESFWARAVARHLGMEHTEVRCSLQEAIEIVPKLSDIYDEPFSDNSAIPTYLICKTARDYVKVVLSGDGGDEFFCGYNFYTEYNSFWGKISAIPIPQPVLSRAGRSGCMALGTKIFNLFCRLFLHADAYSLSDKINRWYPILTAPNFVEAYVLSRSIWSQEQLKYLAPDLQSDIPFKDFPRIDCDPIAAMMLFDAKIYLPDDLLVKIDRASMSVGLEVREPLLDHKLVEYAISLPLKYKYSNKKTKYILKRILYKYLPRDLVDRPKRGFGAPLEQWLLNGSLKSVVLDYLNPRRIREQGIFSSVYIQRMMDDFRQGVWINPNKIWNLVAFELWYER